MSKLRHKSTSDVESEFHSITGKLAILEILPVPHQTAMAASNRRIEYVWNDN